MHTKARCAASSLRVYFSKLNINTRDARELSTRCYLSPKGRRSSLYYTRKLLLMLLQLALYSILVAVFADQVFKVSDISRRPFKYTL